MPARGQAGGGGARFHADHIGALRPQCVHQGLGRGTAVAKYQGHLCCGCGCGCGGACRPLQGTALPGGCVERTGGRRGTCRACRFRCIATLPRRLHPEGAALEGRSEEHTSELQSQSNLVCRLLLEKKKKKKITTRTSICVPTWSTMNAKY